MYSCGHWIAIEQSVVKADGVLRLEGSSPVRIPERERTRDGLLAVLADGSTDEQVKFYLFGKVGK